MSPVKMSLVLMTAEVEETESTKTFIPISDATVATTTGLSCEEENVTVTLFAFVKVAVPSSV